jgi:hypothetical protein
MSCKSCGRADHKRSSSRLCPNNKPRQGKEKPEYLKDEPTWGLGGETVYKVGLETISKDSRLTERISQCVLALTQAAFEGSRLLQYVLSKKIESGDSLPTLDKDYLRSVFSTPLGNTRPINNELTDHYNRVFTQVRDPRYRPARLPVEQSQILVNHVQTYKTNLDLHVKKQVEILGRDMIRGYFLRRGIREKIVTGLVNEIYDVVLDDEKTCSLSDDLLKRFVRPLRRVLSSPQKNQIEWIYGRNRIQVAHGRRTSTLVPIHTISAKYLTISTDILYILLERKKGTGVTMKEFGMEQDEHWNQYFKLKQKHFKSETNPDPKVMFGYMIKTDGAGASVLLKRWVDMKKWSKTEKAEWKLSQDRSRKSVRDRVKDLGRDADWIGIDPGRKDIVTAWREHDAKAINVSNGRYYHECGMTRRKHKWKMWEKETSVHDFSNGAPSIALGHSYNIELHIKYYINNYKYMDLLRLRCCRRVKRLRWDVYVKKQESLDRYCKEIIGERRLDKTIVVAFGDASFNHTFGGHRSSPRRRWVRNRLESHHDVIVIDTPEFNSSLVCSNCHAADRMSPCDNASNNHFVRSCQTCRTIWQRDINACRNMISIARSLVWTDEKPVVFSKRLPPRDKLANSRNKRRESKLMIMFQT